jgi:hypothetical protein
MRRAKSKFRPSVGGSGSPAVRSPQIIQNESEPLQIQNKEIIQNEKENVFVEQQIERSIEGKIKNLFFTTGDKKVGRFFLTLSGMEATFMAQP